MNHQDWDPVVIHNPTAVKRSLPTETVKRIQHTGVKDVDMEDNRIVMVNSQLRKTCEQARLSTKNTRESLAKLIHGDPNTIKLLETGKLSEKEAKQVALKIERALKVKIL
jgi:ribosome-binding protein aMBF1 (putative translation factor)